MEEAQLYFLLFPKLFSMEHLPRKKTTKCQGNIESLKNAFIIIKYCKIFLKIDIPWSKIHTGKKKKKYYN